MKETDMKISVILAFTLFLSFNADFLSANNQAFKSGEKLEYKISYGIIKAGHVSFETKETEFEGKIVYHSSLIARTTGLIDKLYKMYDVYESYYDKKSHLPAFSIANIKEGKYRFYDETTFYQQDLKAKSKINDTLLLLERESFDVVAALNYFRNLDWTLFKVNQLLEIPIFHESKCFIMPLLYRGKKEVFVGNVSYNCHLFTPILPKGKLFRDSKDKMTLWFSDDDNKIPILIKFDLAVGSYRLSLINHENLSHPFDAKSKKTK